MKTHQSCPDCGHNGCMTIFTDGGTFCHSCNKTSKGSSGEDFKEVFIEHRGIPASVAQKYGIFTVVNEKGNPVARRYQYPHASKIRVLPKDFTKNSGFKNDHLFGMDKFQAGSHTTLVIVEGEEDAPSAWLMLGKKYPVVATPGAAINKALLENCKSYLDSFKKIVIIADGDEAGKKLVDTLRTVYPNKCYEVELTKYKDPNEFLQNKADKEFYWAFNNAKKCTMDSVYNTKEQFEAILKDTTVNSFIETPITEFNRLCKGLMKGHFTIITGLEGRGKTELLRMLEYDILKNHNEVPIALCHMEESKNTTLKTFACYELGENVRDPDHKIPEPDIVNAVNSLAGNDNLYLFDISEGSDPLLLLDKIRFLASCGVEYFFIDPIQQLAYDSSEDESTEQVLTKLSVKLSKLCNELDVGVVCTAHVNDNGDIRSCRMLGKSASVRIDLQRDHVNTDEDVRNTTTITVSKNRPIGPCGYGGQAFFDIDTFTMREK